MTLDVVSYLKTKKTQINEHLIMLLKRTEAPKRLKKSMLYSVKAGGKRLRPILMLAVIEAFQCKTEYGMQPAAALEFVHTYSLIHDDLPAMDDDDLRRGLLTNHKKFDEATAILAGDGLLTFAFTCLAQAPFINDKVKLWLIQELANAAGSSEMIGGQMDDIQAEGKTLDIIALEKIYQKKTGRLLEFAVMAGATIANGDQSTKDNLQLFARHLGLAFQIQDDILDIEGDESMLGKPVGSDVGNKKNTYPEILGIEGAKKQLKVHFEKALDALNRTSIQHEALEGIAHFVIERHY